MSVFAELYNDDYGVKAGQLWVDDDGVQFTIFSVTTDDNTDTTLFAREWSRKIVRAYTIDASYRPNGKLNGQKVHWINPVRTGKFVKEFTRSN